MQDTTREAVEAATYRRLIEHLQENSDVQNIDLMILADFCRNCLSKWYRAEAEARGELIDDADARAAVYGMPYGEWKERYQQPASETQLAAMAGRKRT
jgi:hypothetical protein